MARQQHGRIGYMRESNGAVTIVLVRHYGAGNLGDEATIEVRALDEQYDRVREQSTGRQLRDSGHACATALKDRETVETDR